MSSAVPPPPAKTSAYSRSRTFRIGVWALAGAAGLIAWHAIKDTMIARDEKLFTVEGTVIEHRTTQSSGQNRVRMRGLGTTRIQGHYERKTFLQIRKRDGAIAKFSASEWFPTPRSGWQGQPIRVRHDGAGNLYEITVADEIVRDVETTRKYRRIANKKTQPLMVLLIVTGLPLTIIGYLLSKIRTGENPSHQSVSR